MDTFFALLWLATFIGFWACAIGLIIDAIRKKSKKKHFTAMGIFFAIGFVCMLSFSQFACNHEYEVVSGVAATCTVDGEIVSVCSECGDEDVEVVPALGHKMEVVNETAPTYNSAGLITEVCSVCGFERVTEIDNADAVKAYEEEQERLAVEQAEAEAEKAEAERLAVTFDEIYLEYKANELRADETYKNNRYVITAKINGMATGGLLNLTGGATLTMECQVDNTKVFFLASFEQEQEDALKTIDVGDTITFDGECLSAGTWSDCVLLED